MRVSLPGRFCLTVLVLLLATKVSSAQQTDPPASPEPSVPKPWTLYGSIGFPGLTSLALARWTGPIELMAELGTFLPFPAVFTGAAHVQTDIWRAGRLAVFGGATSTALYFWFTGYEGEAEPVWNWGFGPKAGLRFQFKTGAILAVEGGALYGEWPGTCHCSVVPQIMVRLGWGF